MCLISKTKNQSPFWTTVFFFHCQRTKDQSRKFFLTTDFLRQQVHETTSFLALSQEPELQNYGTASSDKSLKAKVKTATTLLVVLLTRWLVVLKPSATDLLVVLLTRSLVVLKTTGYHPNVCCPLSSKKTKQSSRGYQRGRANAKTYVRSTTYGNLCTSVWFCKDTKTEILTLTVCPVLSTFVLFCPVLSRFVPFLGTTNRPPPTCGLVVSLS